MRNKKCICRLCGRKFRSQNGLDNHKIKAHGYRFNPFYDKGAMPGPKLIPPAPKCPSPKYAKEIEI